MTLFVTASGLLTTRFTEAQSLPVLQDCVALTKQARAEYQADHGVEMPRDQTMKVLFQCDLENTQREIAHNEALIAALRKRLAELDLQITRDLAIVDLNNRELARLDLEAGALQRDITATDRRIDDKINAAEAVLRELIQRN